MTTPHDIVTFARTYIGAPWRHQARGTCPKRAVDCAGLLLVVARHFGLPNGDLQGYRRDPGPQFVSNVRRHTDPGTEPIHGAIGIFDDRLQPCHVGIFATDHGVLTLIHADAHIGSVKEEIYSQTQQGLSENLVGVRLFKEVNYNVL